MNARTLLELAREQVVLLDGGMGTMLIDRGLKQGQVPELWNLDHPEIVQEVHREYLSAGAAAILTNTFGASSIKLGAYPFIPRGIQDEFIRVSSF